MADTDAAGPAGPADKPADEPAGKSLLAGRYRIDGALGRGGMSEVFYGYDERLDRPVAIKLLRPSHAGSAPAAPDSPEAAEILDQMERDRKRFLREIRTTAQLEHPGIPAVHDTGFDTGPDGSPRLWLVMQMLRGSTLETVIDSTDYEAAPIGLAEAAAITAQIAAVLADVHRVDIVHRDIKPANVMIVDGGLVKLLDFGIAILRGAGALPRLTQIDRTVGTPPYMSPEQHLGQIVTPASDIYSLGCLLFELLTGDLPFYATADNSLRAQHVRADAPPVRARRPDVPPAVVDLVAAMLTKEPRARPSAEAVYDTLVPLITEPTAGIADGAGETAGTSGAGRAQDNGSGSNGGGPAGSARDSALGTVDDSRDPTRPFRRPLLAPPRRRAPAAGRPALTDADAEQLRANVRALLDNDHPAEAISLLEDGVERAAHDPALHLRLRHLLAAALFYDDQYTRAAALFDAVGGEYRRYFGPVDPEVLDCAYHAGYSYAETGNPDKALPQLRFYVHNADPAAGDDEPDKVRYARLAIAQMLAAAGRPDEALAAFESLRPDLTATYGQHSTQIHSLDKLIDRLRQSAAPGTRSASSTGSPHQ
ncbi:serine/threonine protein kinase [Candidatus Protofrankia californiensis]|uniref:non-specific serine/threonine protein kinase n=1 Tax=Candidatus Protofrankia californiensis TaxID=1839754 RepID=A0A1C3NWC5_9ACTN|nr:serine/threonine protein kinase [Candidatus Protofrankia californiensis]